MSKDKEPADTLMFKLALVGIVGCVGLTGWVSHLTRTVGEQQTLIQMQSSTLRECNGFQEGVRASGSNVTIVKP